MGLTLATGIHPAPQLPYGDPPRDLGPYDQAIQARCEPMAPLGSVVSHARSVRIGGSMPRSRYVGKLSEGGHATGATPVIAPSLSSLPAARLPWPFRSPRWSAPSRPSDRVRPTGAIVQVELAVVVKTS